MPIKQNKIRQYILKGLIISMLYSSMLTTTFARVIEFNTDVLDVEDRNNIDLEQFNRIGFIMPGTYNLKININGHSLSEMSVIFNESETSDSGSVACLSPDIVERLGLTKEALNKALWEQGGQCLNLNSLDGMSVEGDLSTSSLNINVPQAYLEQIYENWDPPSRWDHGISALLFDYNINGAINDSLEQDQTSSSLSGNGVAGVNLGAWRFRGEWQSQINRTTGEQKTTQHNFDWNRIYAYRAIAALQAKLTLGEDFLNSGVFDAFKFIGLGLQSDLNMLPPNLRGYAPEIVGTAKTNATITIRQQGRVIYETQVAQGPFRIQNLSDAITGKMNVTVAEQDGTIQTFDVDTASLPFLTRPGQVQYKFATGKPIDNQGHRQGVSFGMGEFSWGVSNGWSLFGGILGSQDYKSTSIGIGRDLLVFGALSFDITQSIANIPNDGSLKGKSYRLNYSKRFEEYNSQINFAGYRFSERDFMNMSDFLDFRVTGMRYGSSKELYTLSINKNFIESGLSLYFNYNHQTYWDRPANDYYSLMLSKYFDIGSWKNISATVSANRQQTDSKSDDSIYFSVSIPWGSSASLGYSMDISHDNVSNNASYFDTLTERMNYQFNIGNNRKGATTSGYFSYQGNDAWLSTNVNYAMNQYRAAGFSANGGLTITPEGGAFHGSSLAGGTRLLVDTDGVPDIPIRGSGIAVKTNLFGKAVISDMSNYNRNNIQIDLNNLPDNADAQQSVQQATLTEGAVGYRHFDVLSGLKGMVVIRLEDGTYPAFGSQVKNSKGQNTGIVGDEGNTYLSGINADEVMRVNLSSNQECKIVFPKKLDDLSGGLLALCVRENHQ
ncbi:fimbria/pilus outer membrane usher protein [Providencia rettgeri]|uniref:fimbria/pilus outer membrane usher protein n=1 Tax=Providencia rettgeri TaxID=587 RepID=UPI0006913B44|nr:fimbria/pilus outer membrane usher protein [Providencia rettgeri]